MRIVPRNAWARQRWRPLVDMRLPVGELWLHHGGTGSANLATLLGYERYHVQTLGWSGLGYSFAITADGTIYEGRGWGKVGAHTKGRNTISHAILLVGDWTSGTVPQPMVDSLVWLTREGHRVGALEAPVISGGHRQAPGQSTSCPGSGGLEAVARARKILAAPAAPPTVKEDDMTPEQEAKLDEALKLLREQKDFERRARISIRAIANWLHIPTSVNGKTDGTEVIT